MTKIKRIHSLALKKIKNLIGYSVLLVHKDGSKYMLYCTISDIKDERIVSNIYLGKQSLKFQVLFSDLKEKSAPIKGYQYVIMNNQSYAIVEEGFDALQNEMILYGVINKKGI